MSEIRMVSPLLNNMEIESCVSSRGGTSVYIVRSTKSNQTYILKHISVPESQKQVDALIFTGAAASTEEAQTYYSQVAADYQQELETLETLSSSPNLGCFRSYQIEPKEDGVGYDIYLLAENRKTLTQCLQHSPMTRLSAVNLGLDLCSALSELRSHGLLHRDVKPSNIYLSNQGHFVLGDLGIAQIEELRFCSMPENMLSSYSAPELFSLIGNIHPTTDLYSTGLILYRIFNGNHGPFEDESTGPKAADKRRVTGEQLPPPMYADYELSEILLKACAFQPEERYQTPEELREALMAYTLRNEVDDTLIVPPIVADPEPVDLTQDEEDVVPVNFAEKEELPEDFRQNFSPDAQMLNSIIESVHRDMAAEPLTELYGASESDEPDEEDEQEPASARRKKKKNPIPAILLTVLLLALAAYAVVRFVLPAAGKLHIDGISLVSKSSDTITVRVQTDAESGSFGVLCSDAYGNTTRQTYTAGSDNTFTGLQNGTQYTFTVEPNENRTVTGSASFMAATLAETRVLTFSVQPTSLTEADISIVLDGPDQPQWTVRYFAAGVDAKDYVMTGHTGSVSNLHTDCQYTFELMAPEGVLLTGETTAQLSTVARVDLESITAAINNKTALLSWKFVGDAPEFWNVEVSGTDGMTQSQVVTVPQITIEGLVPGQEYTILISAPTMLDVYSTSIRPTMSSLRELTVVNNSDGSVTVNWDCDPTPDPPIFTLSCTLKDFETENNVLSWIVEGNSYTIPAGSLLPAMQYSAEVTLFSGEHLDNAYAVVFTSPEAERYREHGFGNVYVGLFPEPSVEGWTSANLTNSRNNFKVGEPAAFAMQPIETLGSSSDSVEILLIIRDSNGGVVSVKQYASVWDRMWTGSLFVGGFPEMPKETGSYELEFYFNGKFAAKKGFTVE